MKEPLLIRFGCSIRLPAQGTFHFEEFLKTRPEEFLKLWIEGSISNIYLGPGAEVKIKFIPNAP